MSMIFPLLQSFIHNYGANTVLLATLATRMPAKMDVFVEPRTVAYTVAVTIVSSYVISITVIPCIRRLLARWNTISMALKFGGHLAALRFVERYIDDPADATNTMRILETMTCSDQHILKAVVEMGGIETSIKALKKFTEESESVASNGCGLLCNFCGYSAEYNRRVLECGGITAIVQAMKQWPENEQVQIHASTALDRLASDGDSAVRMKIVDVGGLITLAQARTTHQNDMRVSLPTNHALVQLVQQEQKQLSD